MNLHQLFEELADLIRSGVMVNVDSVEDQWRVVLHAKSTHIGRLCELEDLTGSLEDAIASFNAARRVAQS